MVNNLCLNFPSNDFYDFLYYSLNLNNLSYLLYLRNNFLYVYWYLNRSLYYFLYCYYFLNKSLNNLNLRNKMVNSFFSNYRYLNFYNFLDNFLNCLNLRNLYNNLFYYLNDPWYFNNNFLDDCCRYNFLSIIINIFYNLYRHMNDSFYLLNFDLLNYFLDNSIDNNNLRDLNNPLNNFLYNFIYFYNFWDNSKHF
jgi:hypothetical protein